jgi:outer membrane receptor for ferrienterochelin and colicins
MISVTANSQTIKGKITSKNEVVPFANIIIDGTKLGVSADENGSFVIENVPLGHHHIITSAV